jgi:hypothetical protein
MKEPFSGIHHQFERGVEQFYEPVQPNGSCLLISKRSLQKQRPLFNIDKIAELQLLILTAVVDHLRIAFNSGPGLQQAAL